MITLVLLSMFTAGAFADNSAQPKYCVFWGFLNDIVYRYTATCSDGKVYFRDSFLGPLSSSRRKALKERVLKDMAKDDLVPVLTFAGYEIVTQKWNAGYLEKSTLCLTRDKKIKCTPGATLSVDGTGNDSADTTLMKNGYSKVFDRTGIMLHLK
jgi:hypothetical protein